MTESEHSATDGHLSKVHRDVLSLAEVPRRAGDIAFLLGDPSMKPVVEGALRDLEDSSLVAGAEHGLWHRTSEGSATLQAVEAWVIRVDDVFRVTGRPRPIVVGEVLTGSVYTDDWFLVDQKLGRVLSIELASGPDRRRGSLSFTADLDLEPGDVLRGHEPRAA